MITTLSLEFLDFSRLVLYKIVTEDLNFKKMCSRWVPRLITEKRKYKRFAILLGFWILNEEEGNDMLSQIVTRDKHGYPISPQNKINIRWKDDTPPLQSRSKPNKHC
ncbi:uncharacterized protein TNCV_2133281 [Trichonephila clavipes]|nr:uncharacterized protein TNCV_2133281 [Trichonephila clavipes]